VFGRGEFNGAQATLRSCELERVVGERSGASEAAAKASRGGAGSENAGMSNEKGVRIPFTDCPRFPE
jgi:hypothetical protein